MNAYDRAQSLNDLINYYCPRCYVGLYDCKINARGCPTITMDKDFETLMNAEKKPRYLYGMRLRGFSIGCQPKDGLIERRDAPTDEYYDILVYGRKLWDRELEDYDLTYLGTEGSEE